MKKYLFIVLLILSQFLLIGQEETLRVEPPNWWVDMKHNNLQLLLHQKDISKFDFAKINSPDIQISAVTKVESPNYLFVDLIIDKGLKPGEYNIVLFSYNSSESITIPYSFYVRKEHSADRNSFSSEDVIYLLMPDRFANGNPGNDSHPTTLEKVNRNQVNGRHGGDIQGIIDHLDYLEDLGITAIWSTPMMLDNEPNYSYHTYAISDYYQIDPRYGSNEDYKSLASECHKRGIKLIMDVVTNHCGISHWWMKDLPQSNWVHPFPEFTRSNHRKQTLNDPYGAVEDHDLYNEGWFDTTMPDMDQTNDFLLNYFIQNNIWWVEYADLNGLRVDTYPYNDKWAIANWSKAILSEYPKLNIVGECWQHKPSELAYWQSGVDNYDGYNSYLPAGMDFYLTDQLEKAFNEDDQGWDNGVARFYNSLATDYLYADPYNLMIFCDNHDITRYSGLVENDKDKFKLAFSFLLTTRGIPQIYYGSEIMMGGLKSVDDGDIRRDFPGGWPGDERNAFTPEGRTKVENEVFMHFKTLLNYRKNNPVLHTGSLTHFIPENNIYVYFRENEEKVVMVILNNNSKKISVDLSRYNSKINDFKVGKDILSCERITIQNSIDIKAKGAKIIEFLKNN